MKSVAGASGQIEAIPFYSSAISYNLEECSLISGVMFWLDSGDARWCELSIQTVSRVSAGHRTSIETTSGLRAQRELQGALIRFCLGFLFVLVLPL